MASSIVPQLAANSPPPPDYYAENLRQLITHVHAHYDDVLREEETGYGRSILACSDPAQRLYARLLSRRGPWIRVDKLRYREVPDIAAALGELEEAGLAIRSGPAPGDALLGLLSAAERRELFPAIDDAPKALWIARCVERYSDAQVRSRLAAAHPWVSVGDYPTFWLHQLLFFGDTRQDLSAFVLQDLGLVRYEPYDVNPRHRQFADREQLDDHLRHLELGSLSHRLEEQPTLAWWLGETLWAEPGSRWSQRSRDRTANRLGRWHERRGEYDEALASFARSTSHPARERTARILDRLGDAEGVQAVLHAMRSEPRSAEEEDFAGRFGPNGRRKRHAHRLELLPDGKGARVEQLAVDVLTDGGGRGWHLENRFSLGLAGLAFWPVVFADVPGAFVNPFQQGPVDLFWPDFVEQRGTMLEVQLERLATPGGLAGVVMETWRSKFGVANRLVSWAHFDEDLLDAVLGHVPEGDLLRLAEFTLRNLHRLRKGFPDLLVIRAPGDYEFVEVKGPTDQLQPVQRVWLDALDALALPARVLRFKA
jgi:hypothetical protein